MRRRRVLAGAGAVSVAAFGGWLAVGGLGRSGSHLDAMTVAGIDGPGSTAGPVTVPAADTVTVLDVFATWCRSCDQQHRHLTEATAFVDDATFISVTAEQDRAAVEHWWRTRGGGWQAGLDPSLEVTEAVGATGVPFLAVIDATGTVTWTAAGVREAEEIVAAVEAASRRTGSTG